MRTAAGNFQKSKEKEVFSENGLDKRENVCYNTAVDDKLL